MLEHPDRRVDIMLSLDPAFGDQARPATLTTLSQEILYGMVSPSSGLDQLQSEASQNKLQFTATHPGWQ